MIAGLEEYVHLGLDTRKVVRMHALAPEIRIVEIFAGGIAEQPRDVVADEGRREIAPGLEAVDHRRRGIEQPGQPGRCRGFDLSQILTLFVFALTRCVGQDTLDDFGHFSGVSAVSQHFTKGGGSNLGVFSGRGH